MEAKRRLRHNLRIEKTYSFHRRQSSQNTDASSDDETNSDVEVGATPTVGRRLWGVARGNLEAILEQAPHPTEQQQQSDSAFAYSQLPGGEGEERLFNGDRPSSSHANLFIKLLTSQFSLGAGLALHEATLEHNSAGERPGNWAPRSDLQKIKHMLTSSYLNVLLICIPIGIIAGSLPSSTDHPTLIFSSNFLALVPMALILGEVTEDLAIRFGDAIGGLLNATFGNVVEMILAIAALHRGLFTVVATSLIGSILSNLLLVLGMCFLLGGVNYKNQSFNLMANKVSCSLLFMACCSLIIPSSAKAFYGPQVITTGALMQLSYAISIMLIVTYGCYLFFQLKTHADSFNGTEGNESIPALSLSGALSLLTVITLTVATCSEFLTGAIEAVSEQWGVNQAFLGLIMLPIAGNACEHITAVFVAMKDKMDLAIGVALGSSIQIAIFVIPVVVMAGWAMGIPFTLDFDLFSVLMLTLSVILAYFVSSDGSSNWLLGLQLVAIYVIIGSVFFLEKEAPK